MVLGRGSAAGGCGVSSGEPGQLLCPCTVLFRWRRSSVLDFHTSCVPFSGTDSPHYLGQITFPQTVIRALHPTGLHGSRALMCLQGSFPLQALQMSTRGSQQQLLASPGCCNKKYSAGELTVLAWDREGEHKEVVHGNSGGLRAGFDEAAGAG